MKYVSLFIVLVLFSNIALAQDRGLKLVKKPTENPTNQKRKAIVIGMSDYGANKSLSNTLNDANDMADVLTKLGFEVTLLKDNDLRNLNTNLSNWYTSIEGNDMAVFYFAGHGMEVNGQNYLIPVDADLNSQTDVQYNALNVNQILGNMDEKRVGMKFLILDACRDNPFTRSWSRSSGDKGLAGMIAPTGTYIAFAAAPGSTAQDGGTYNLKNGVFTHFLKREILKEGASIDNILNRVARDVSELTNDQQLPYKTGILKGDFYFIPPVDKPSPTMEVDEEKQDWVNRMMVIESKLPPEYLNESTWLMFFYQRESKASDSQLLKVATAARYLNNNPSAKLRLVGYTTRKEGTPMGNMMLSESRAKNTANLLVTKFGIDGNRLTVEWKGDQESPFRENDANEIVIIFAEGGKPAPTPMPSPAPVVNVAELMSQADVYNNNKQYSNAFSLYKQAADEGNAEAQNMLGIYYNSGWSVTKDYTQAAFWYKKAAEQGYATAQLNLGFAYYVGEIVTKDYTQAAFWYRKAADQGSRSAQAWLAHCYKEGHGLTKDYVLMVYWLKKAAEQGNADAQNNLGECYEKGQGVTKDIDQAFYWYKKAEKQGVLAAREAINRINLLTDTEDKKPFVNINGIKWAKYNADSPGTFATSFGVGSYYTWDEAKKVCPSGWRLPSLEEFKELLKLENEWTQVGDKNVRKFHINNQLLIIPARNTPNTSQRDPLAGHYWSQSTISGQIAILVVGQKEDEYLKAVHLTYGPIELNKTSLNLVRCVCE